MNPLLLLRLARMARKRPSEKLFFVVLGVIVMALVIAGLTAMGWWPEWAEVEPIRRGNGIRIPAQ